VREFFGGGRVECGFLAEVDASPPSATVSLSAGAGMFELGAVYELAVAAGRVGVARKILRPGVRDGAAGLGDAI